jgi:hypothetical protein
VAIAPFQRARHLVVKIKGLSDKTFKTEILCHSKCELSLLKALIAKRKSKFAAMPPVMVTVVRYRWGFLFQNHWANFKKIWHKSFLDEGDLSLFKERGYLENCSCNSKQTNK